MSPVAVSDRALERVRDRRTPVPFSLDLELLRAYWVERPATYHHTAPILHIYALHEALRQTLLEGLDAALGRHAEAGAHLQGRVRSAGFDLVAEPDHQLAPLTAIRVPDGTDGKSGTGGGFSPRRGSRSGAASARRLPRCGGSG